MGADLIVADEMAAWKRRAGSRCAGVIFGRSCSQRASGFGAAVLTFGFVVLGHWRLEH